VFGHPFDLALGLVQQAGQVVAVFIGKIPQHPGA
jgi:hypothetical protein